MRSCNRCSNPDQGSMSSPLPRFPRVPGFPFLPCNWSLLIYPLSLDLTNIRSYPESVLQTPEKIAPDGPRLAMELVGLRQQIDRMELRFSELAVAYKKTDHWDDEGSISAIDWIRFNCRMTSNAAGDRIAVGDRKSTRLNSSHSSISYAVFCLKKKNKSKD